MHKKKEKRLSFTKSTLLILLSVCLITGLPTAIYFSWHLYLKYRAKDPSHMITQVVVGTDSAHPLSEKYILQLCNLSKEKNVHYYSLSIEKMQKRLRSSPWITKAEVKRENAHTLLITYKNRYPIIKIADKQNLALSNDLRLIPYLPFFESLPLPTLILPKEWEGGWGEGINVEISQTMLEIFDDLGREKIELLDLRGLFAKSFGKKEIVVQLKVEERRSILRLNAYHYMEGLAKYHRLLAEGMDQWSVYDLRMSQIALVR